MPSRAQFLQTALALAVSAITSLPAMAIAAVTARATVVRRRLL